MKIAFIYDHINRIGGAERILTTLHELFPTAPFYTCVYDPSAASWARTLNIRTSILQRFPLLRKHHEWFPGIPFLTFESLDLSEFDIVVSITSAEAKAVITGNNTLHICICLTPTRYIWSHFETYFKSTFIKFFTLPIISFLRLWDFISAQRVDRYYAISKTVQRRIVKYYRRGSQLLYPPVDTDFFTPARSQQKKNFFLIVSRLVTYKKIELAVEVCTKYKIPLTIVGKGPNEVRLKQNAGPTIRFLGNVSDEKLRDLYRDANALLFLAEEDFGIAMVESLSCGTPVIAYKKGGASEIVNNKTGVLFSDQTAASLHEALNRFGRSTYNSTLCRRQALHFSKESFKKKFDTLVRKEWEQFKVLHNI